jgi:hypothetical protein
MDSVMAEGTEEESDGVDDTEFLAEHQKYLEDIQQRTLELHRLEEERRNVLFIPPKIC